jgi:hypothetical protein
MRYTVPMRGVEYRGLSRIEGPVVISEQQKNFDGWKRLRAHKTCEGILQKKKLFFIGVALL